MADRDTTTDFRLLGWTVSLDAARRRLLAIALGTFLFTCFGACGYPNQTRKGDH